MNPTEDGMEPETSDEDVIPPQIEELLRSRSTLVEWLERLEERRDDVRPAVYEKVRDDYRGRLSEVEDHLSEHRSDLERALDERRGAVRELEEERDERAAELEEVELRHEVGELEEDEWEEESGELRDVLDDLEESLEGERGAVERLEEVLDELAGLEGGAVAGAEEPAVGAPRPEADEGPAAGPADGGPDGEPSGEPGTAAGFGPEVAGAPEPEETADETGRSEAADDTSTGDEEPAIEGGDGWPAPELADADETGPGSVGTEEDGAAGAGTGAGTDGDAGSDEDTTPEGGRGAAADGDEEADDFDELDFLESLSLDEPDSLDTLGMELDQDEESASDGDEAGEEDREGPGG